MFEYIGRKIKVLAKVLFWLSLIGSILVGLIAMIWEIAEGEGYMAIAILFLVLLGNIVNCIWCWLVYGLGQLIDNTDKLVSQNNNTNNIDNE